MHTPTQKPYIFSICLLNTIAPGKDQKRQWGNLRHWDMLRSNILPGVLTSPAGDKELTCLNYSQGSSAGRLSQQEPNPPPPTPHRGALTMKLLWYGLGNLVLRPGHLLRVLLPRTGSGPCSVQKLYWAPAFTRAVWMSLSLPHIFPPSSPFILGQRTWVTSWAASQLMGGTLVQPKECQEPESLSLPGALSPTGTYSELLRASAVQ